MVKRNADLAARRWIDYVPVSVLHDLGYEATAAMELGENCTTSTCYTDKIWVRESIYDVIDEDAVDWFETPVLSFLDLEP